jgi:hypothetical protein
MTASKAFDEMMEQFVGELGRSFPEAAPTERPTSSEFMHTIAPWSQKLMAKDETFFCEENKLLNLHSIWTREDCSGTSKDAIWQYLSSLYMMGTMFSMIPPSMLSMIEAAAENAAKNMTSGGEPDMMKMMEQLMGGVQTPKRIKSKKNSR